MSFGYSVGDFIALGTLAWGVYKSCKEAPETFHDISSEVSSLYVVLKEAEETVFAQPLSPAKQERLKVVGDGCYGVLTDLDNLCKKYQSLGTQSKRTWDRMRWGSEDIAELRARLISNTGLLTAWISMSQANVLTKLNNFLQEFKEGKREGSVISAQTNDSLCTNDKQLWHTIRKELEDIGITVAAFNANKEFIFEWFLNAVSSGAFEEQSSDDSPIAEPHERSSDDVLRGNLISSGAFEEQSSDDSLIAEPHERSSDDVLRVVKSASREQLWLKAQKSDPPVRQVVVSSPRMALPSIKTIPPDPLLRHVTAPRPHIPRVAALIARVSRPNKSLITAAQQKNPLKVCEILNDQRKAVWLDRKSLSWALRIVADQGHEQAVSLLLQKGADANACGRYESDTALVCASRNGHEQIVRLLLKKGVDANTRGGYDFASALVCASRNGHEQIVRLLLKKGANANAYGGYPPDLVLVCASQNGHEQIVRLLLEKGADPNAHGAYGVFALECALQNGHEQIVRLLLEKGANANAHRGDHNSVLVCASRKGLEQIVRLLLEKGADINAAGAYGPALVCASRNRHEQIVGLLLEKGAHINAVGKHYDTALMCASQNGDHKIVQLLLEKGADVKYRGTHGWPRTALQAARGHEQVVRLLLEHGA